MDSSIRAVIDRIEARAGTDVLERAADVQWLLLDVDGVMTDGGLIQGDDALEHKQFHARDGLGFSMLKQSDIKLAIITGRRSKVVANRARELGIETLYQGSHDKLGALDKICSEQGLEYSRCAFMGDDLIDLPPMRRCRLALCPSDAHELVAAHAHWISRYPGGSGAVRDAIELLLHARGQLALQLSTFLQ